MSQPSLLAIDLFGIACDAGASRRGCVMGPEALRIAGLTAVLADLGHDVTDCGDIAAPASRDGSTPWQSPAHRKAEVLAIAAQSRAKGSSETANSNVPRRFEGWL